MQKHPLSFHLIRIITLAVTALILLGAAGQVHRVAWGTGNWLGEYSLKWGIGFFLFAVFCSFLFFLALLAAYAPQKLPITNLQSLITNYHLPLTLRWLLIILFIIAPIWLFQYTYWGMVLTSLAFRLFVWAIAALLIAYLISPTSHPASSPITNYQSLFTALLLTGAAFAAAIPLVNVTSYPFALEWSEGNRLWDYSIMFGRDLYIYPADKPLAPFLDVGRQWIGGLPFLLPHVTIAGERLWVALVAIVPYLLLGWSAFTVPGAKRSSVFLAALWTFLFLRQGPIHPPLVLSAILVALTWRRPLWISLPAIAVASAFASISRFTWMFAPGMWAAMLVLAETSATAQPANPSARTWGRAILLGLAGAVSGYFIRQIGLIPLQGGFEMASGVLKSQPLLWYRLLPNSTYDLGILVNLALAVLPALTVLLLLARRADWPLSFWQKLVVALPLLAFLAVGLTASTKIGGGADLHNLDMFLIGTMFAASLAWTHLATNVSSTSGPPRGDNTTVSRTLMMGLLVMAFLPSLAALKAMTPILRADDLERLKVLTGREDIYRNDPNLLGFLPTEEKTARALNVIRNEVAAASESGEVLFMDQRQLLTFGFVTGLPLVPEYDKKYLMDRAMTDTYLPVFESFYADLAAHRFTLILTDPLRKPLKGSDFSFGEENDAWVKWVAAPILCYYTVQADLNDVRIQLLVPRDDAPVCELPQ